MKCAPSVGVGKAEGLKIYKQENVPSQFLLILQHTPSFQHLLYPIILAIILQPDKSNLKMHLPNALLIAISLITSATAQVTLTTPTSSTLTTLTSNTQTQTPTSTSLATSALSAGSLTYAGTSLSNVFTNTSLPTGTLVSSLTSNLTAVPTGPITPNATAPAVIPGEYYLRVQHLAGATGGRYHKWWLGALQTSANASDLIITQNKSQAIKFYANGTAEMADFGTPTVPWSLSVTENTNYASKSLSHSFMHSILVT